MHSRQWKNEDNDLEVGVRLVRLRKRKANRASVKTEIRRVKRNGTVCGLCVGFMDHGVGLGFLTVRRNHWRVVTRTDREESGVRLRGSCCSGPGECAGLLAPEVGCGEK